MKPIFTGNDDFNKSAFVNWRTSKHENIQNLLVLADGFLSASIELAKSALSDNSDKKADILIFPILTNANHGIELYLKALVWTLNKLLSSPNKIEGKHNIKQIFQNVRSKVNLYEGNLSIKEFNMSTKELEAYITELFNKVEATNKDDKMDFSRYPINNDYDNHFYVDAIGNIEVDLENFVLRFEIIKERLEMMSSFLLYQELNHDW